FPVLIMRKMSFDLISPNSCMDTTYNLRPRPEKHSATMTMAESSGVDYFRLTKKNIDGAMSYLEQIHRDMEEVSDREQVVEEPGIIIKENISMEAFLRFIDKEPKLLFKIRLIDGRIIAYEVPGGPHSKTANRVVKFFTDATGHLPYHDRLLGGNE